MYTRRSLHHALLALTSIAVLGLPTSSALAQPAASTVVPKEFKVGYQKGSSILLLARKQQVIEKRLQTLGVSSVKWVEFQFGPPMLEALGLGAIDIGAVGDTPPIFAQAGEANLVYVAATPSAPTAVLVPGNSPIQSVAQLKGKKVAFGKGSSAHNVAIKALAKAGLKLTDVVPTYLAPADATAAFNGGNIDAWVVWDPYYAIAQKHYGARLLTDTTDRSLVSSSYYMANRDTATKYPRVLSAALEELGKVTVWAGSHRSELAQIAAEATGIDAGTWEGVFQRTEFSWSPVTEAHIAQQQQLADTFHELNIVPRKFKVADIVWKDPGKR